jgi:hypothetical protein
MKELGSPGLHYGGSDCGGWRVPHNVREFWDAFPIAIVVKKTTFAILDKIRAGSTLIAHVPLDTRGDRFDPILEYAADANRAIALKVGYCLGIYEIGFSLHSAHLHKNR